MGFVASEAVEKLTYDFTGFDDWKGDIPEPSSHQLDEFRQALSATVTALGISPEDVATGKIKLEQIPGLMEKGSIAEQAMVDAVADLTGLPNQRLNKLPYRVKAAFVGYITGVFNSNPEA